VRAPQEGRSTHAPDRARDAVEGTYLSQRETSVDAAEAYLLSQEHRRRRIP
jgi:hypothetical protein